MKKIVLVAAVFACATASLSFAAESGAKRATVPAETASASTELMGFDTVNFGGQEIRVAVTKETTADATAFCRQYVESYTHEIATANSGSAALPIDKTTVVLGKSCKWAPKG